MVAFNFKQGFVIPIMECTKAQTIRAPRTDGRDHCKTGDALQLFTGMRTKACRQFGAARCLTYEDITLDFSKNQVAIAGAVQTFSKTKPLDAFARSDGFADWQAMGEFWLAERGVRCFEGRLIRWADFRPVP